MGSSKRQKTGTASCAHVAGCRARQPQLQAALLRQWQARKTEGGLLLSLGEGVVCLGCGAAAPSLEAHLQAHARKPAAGHEVLLDLPSGELYCSGCRDFIYDKQWDHDLRAALTAVDCPNGAATGDLAEGQDPQQLPPAAAAIKDDPAASSHQPQNQAGLWGGGPGSTFQPVATDGFPSGLRGLNNLGNTCFMNSVLQALLHAPPLRAYYLHARHPRGTCTTTADGGCCINCEMDAVFSAAYSGCRAGFSPAHFLYAWWMLAGGHMAGYQQQDAHEFFLFILEMLAATAASDSITQRVFGGSLRSDVVCCNCGHTSTSHEQFSHISLDIPPPQQLMPPPIVPRPNGHGPPAASRAPKLSAAAVSKMSRLSGAAKASKARALAKAAAAAVAAAAVASDVSAAEHQPEESSSGAEDDGGSVSMGLVMGPAAGALEAASGIATGEDSVLVDDDAQDTLCSPRTMGLSALPSMLHRAASAAVGSMAALLPLPSGRPPVAPCSGGGKRGGGAGRQAQGSTSPPAGGQPSDPAAATLDAVAAASNVPGSQTLEAAAGGPPAGLPPQLAGYWRWPGPSLQGCLARFTRAERLGPGERWTCERCQSQHQAVKQLSLRQLPPLLVFHAKRFEHPGDLRAAAKKLDTFLSFPLHRLDMRPYLASAALRGRYHLQGTHAAGGGGGGSGRHGASGAGAGTSAAESGAAEAGSSTCYDLFAVVCHRGSFQGGHYVAYVRAADGRWYLCDDAWVTAVDEEVVRGAQAYMLFYGQRQLLQPPAQAAAAGQGAQI